MTATRREMQALQMDDAEESRRIDTLTYQINELERGGAEARGGRGAGGQENILRSAGKDDRRPGAGGVRPGRGRRDRGGGESAGHCGRRRGPGGPMRAPGPRPGGSAVQTAERLAQMRYDAYDALEQARDLRGSWTVPRRTSTGWRAGWISCTG